MKINNENNTFKITSYEETYTVRLVTSHYVINNSLAIMLEYYDEEYKSWEPYSSLTVYICDLPEGYVCLDQNNLGSWEEILALFKDNDLGEATGHVVSSGFCNYPVFKINMENLKKFAISHD